MQRILAVVLALGALSTISLVARVGQLAHDPSSAPPTALRASDGIARMPHLRTTNIVALSALGARCADCAAGTGPRLGEGGGAHLLPGAGERTRLPQLPYRPTVSALIEKLSRKLAITPPTPAQLARDITVLVSSKDVPSSGCLPVLDTIMDFCGPRGVRVVYILMWPLRLGLEEHIEQLNREYGGLITTVKLHAYTSQIQARREVIADIDTKYTLFMESTASCESSDCLEALWMEAEASQRGLSWSEKSPAGDGLLGVPYEGLPFVAWEPLLFEDCFTRVLHGKFVPKIVWRKRGGEVENTIRFGYTGHFSSKTATNETVAMAREWGEEHRDGQFFLEDHGFLGLTAFFAKYRDEVFHEQSTSRYEFMHHGLIITHSGARVMAVTDISLFYQFWCPADPAALSWPYVQRHFRYSHTGCMLFPAWWDAHIDDHCFPWVLLMLRRLQHAHWTYEQPSNFTPTFYPPSADRGFQHAQLILTSFLMMGYERFTLFADGESVNAEPLPIRNFFTQLGQWFDEGRGAQVAVVEVQAHRELLSESEVAIRVPRSQYAPDEQFDRAVHPKRILDRVLPYITYHRARPHVALKRADREEYTSAVGWLAYACESSRLARLDGRGVMSVLHVTDGGPCAAGETVHYHWMVDGHEGPLGDESEQRSRRTVRSLGDSPRMRIPAHAQDDAVTLREYRFVTIDTGYFGRQ